MNYDFPILCGCAAASAAARIKKPECKQRRQSLYNSNRWAESVFFTNNCTHQARNSDETAEFCTWRRKRTRESNIFTEYLIRFNTICVARGATLEDGSWPFPSRKNKQFCNWKHSEPTSCATHLHSPREKSMRRRWRIALFFFWKSIAHFPRHIHDHPKKNWRRVCNETEQVAFC